MNQYGCRSGSGYIETIHIFVCSVMRLHVVVCCTCIAQCTHKHIGILNGARGEPKSTIYASVNIFIEWLLVQRFVQTEHRNAAAHKIIGLSRCVSGCTHLCIHNIV